MAIKKYYVTVNDKNGATRWYKDPAREVLHRENGPAVEWVTGTKEWWQDGLQHRTDGPAIEWFDGSTTWYQNGQVHRMDGPAVEYANGIKIWFQNNKQHRMDGPAVVSPDGNNLWYLQGVRMTEAEFLAATQPVVEMTVADVEKLVGKRVKIIK